MPEPTTAAPTTSETPATPAESSTVAADVDNFDFDGLDSELADIEDSLESPVMSEPTAPASETAAAVAPSAPPAPPAPPASETPPATAPGTQPAAEPAASAPQAPAEPSEPSGQQPQAPAASAPETVEELVSAMQMNETSLVDQLAPQFALSQEVADALETDPIATLPKILAQTHVRAVGTALRYVQTLVPQMLARETQRQAQASQNEQAFFARFGVLNDPKYHADIRQTAQVIQAAMPNASFDEKISRIGQMVLALHGLPGGTAPAAATPSAPPAPPAAPVPFHPAAGSGPVSSMVVQPQAWFDGLDDL